MTSATSAALGWSVVFLVAGGFYYMSSQRKNKNRRAPFVRETSKSNESRRESKSKKTTRGSESRKIKQEEGPSTKTHQISADHIPQQSSLQTKKSAEVIKNEPAIQITGVKTSAVLSTTAQNSHGSKSVRLSQAHEKQDLFENNRTAENSDNATGNEADDESTHDSPKIGIKTIASIPASQDVSDMLENSSKQPTVLRVTAPVSNRLDKPENQRAPKKVNIQETKKQRQNRQKAAEAKILRAQEEQVRKAKMEIQRRTAREAEGRAAKDGSLFMASQAPQSSAWEAQPIPSNPSTNSKSEQLKSESEDLSINKKMVTVVSEEEQVRHALKETESWSIVKGKEKRNKTTKSSDTELTKSESKARELSDTNSTYTAPSLPNPIKRYPAKEEGKYAEENNFLDDSEWEVS
ncbi:hypothetical protein GcM1_181001 [Golovinomyces cichoracearum]|uniref:Uncharacterized protein n=1 Tax=Golovinomyces cichoracearum TaxID=62708 RepID=A0A420J402_9PEZI|nr:hypothetical protein GcM1_181001 [Golovinomyces cichoracearum]